jgi:hypothetical protein
MTKVVSIALSCDALFQKSKVYISRGLRAKSEGSVDEYQLWASLALELLAKSSLSAVHPALIADPTHYQSLFAACGHEISPDVKTITAKTLFERLAYISKGFDKRIQTFCLQMALRRNSELHSGESPFSASAAESWEAKFWYAAHTILQIQDVDFEDWLGSEEAVSKRQTLLATREAVRMMVSTRITHAREDFEKKHQNEVKREELVDTSRNIRPWEHWKEFTYLLDTHIVYQCPACHGTGVLGGSKFEEYVSEEQDRDDPYLEYVDVEYSSEEFFCPLCQLHLQGTQEISAASLPGEFTETEEREREFEPDYGND